MMSDICRSILVLGCILISVFLAEAQNKQAGDTVIVRVVDKGNIPLYGVHVILKPGDVLLGSTDDKGEVKLPFLELPAGAALHISSIGYKKETVSPDNLRKNPLVKLEAEVLNLDEVVVRGVKANDVLKQAQKEKERSNRKIFAEIYEQYYGEAQYMKITECFGQAVEFRREYGCFLTTGNIKRNGDFSTTVNDADELEFSPFMRKELVGDNFYVSPDQQAFNEEWQRIGGDIFTPAGRFDLFDVFDKVLARADVTADFKNKIMKYKTTTDVFDKYDMEYDFSFIPAYSQRSLPMDMLCEDTLSVLFNKNFDAGSNKLFTIMRCIYLYGPIFSSAADFDFEMVDPRDKNDCYVIGFKTKVKRYPRHTSMFSEGTLWIDISTKRLTKMKFDFCFYHLYRLGKQSAALPPYETAVVAEFAYDEENVCYINTCRSITFWPSPKEREGTSSIYPVESPSRPLPDEVELREIEGFKVYSFKKIPPEQQNEEIGTDARLAIKNPTGEYKTELFDTLPYLWNCANALVSLNRFMPIKEQFELNSGRTYYNQGGKFLDLEKSAAARKRILTLFFKDKQ